MYLVRNADVVEAQKGAIPQSLAGRKILVLGGQARSMAAVCRLLLAQGARLAVVDAVVDFAADILSTANPGQAVALLGDMRDPQALIQAVDLACNFMSGIDGLCFFGDKSVRATPQRVAGLVRPIKMIARHSEGAVVLIREHHNDVDDLMRLRDALIVAQPGIRMNTVSTAAPPQIASAVTPQDVAHHVRFLLSHEARALNGQSLRLGRN